MAKAEKYAWASLIAMAAVFSFFQMRMLDGWSIPEQAAGKLFWAYGATIGLATIAEIIIALVLAAGDRAGVPEKDERDIAIELRASQVERWVLLVAVNVIVFQILADNAFENHIFPRYDLTRPEVLFFVLFTALFAGEIAKRIATLWLYRVHGKG